MDHGSQILDMNLPPGFRFHPTDEELISHYLAPKVADTNFGATVIGELDLNRFEPWDLPLSTKMGEEWYFFYTKDRKYPTGLRTNRATGSGYWKATGKDKEIHKRKNLIGMKKTLVFYKGRAPKGEKTNWVMHEYRLERNQSKVDESAMVICRVFCRRPDEKKDMELVDMGSWFGDELNASVLVPSMDDNSKNKNNKDRSSSASNTTHVTCFSNYFVGLNSYNSFLPTEDLNRQGDSLVKLFENYGHSSEKNLKIEKEVLGISEEIGLITNMQPDTYPAVRSNFNCQDF